MATVNIALLLATLQCVVISVRCTHMISTDPMHSDSDLEVIHRETVDRCAGPGSLDLSRAGLSTISNKFLKNTCVTAISLEGNDLTRIPQDAFNEVPALECLNLARNRIPFNRYTTYDHENLKTLILSYQRDSYHPRGQEELEMERYVGNEFSVTFGLIDSTIPVFPNLQYLDLSGSKFKDLPKYFNMSFPRLIRLDITDRNIKDLWEDFVYSLPSTLTSLHFEKNGLTEIFLPYTANIESLHFDENRVKPNAIYIRSPLLKELSLSNCTMRSVSPASFDEVRNLLSLDLSWNLLEELPEAVMVLQHLERLSLSHNRLQTFPDFGSHALLKELSLSYNYIDDLLHTISLPSLRRLSLRGNRIGGILASTFSGTPDLQELDLAENHLTVLPQGWTHPARGLRYLNLKYNRFASVADMSLDHATGLADIFIKSNATTVFDVREIDRLTNNCLVHVV